MKIDRPVFVLRLQTQKNVNAVRALRHVLKKLLRTHGMKCLSVEESPADTDRVRR